MSIEEWCRMKRIHLVELWLEGYNKRHRTAYEIGRVLARVTASAAGCKNLPEDFPYRLPWDGTDIEDDGKTEAQRREELERMLPEIEASLRKTMEQNNKTE